ncbi:hypothetical protein M409DRAFT_18871 [Zasmidium cellare ATCC 36951]|uniref:Heterokaryon incompatibility domain-containing protein n=1 Tax=Zasmidium cellare ATCC 36951 TaxID=1080233 RepID=A0A6A6CXC0_ZASCE|nr:uncharacterized protein M409DRAFT_18871 [Zasmidium cellare ATCC 36951]KAF2170898.1 hypothetical protein M409DRAFT_18871 [Zasmidium cellare ATCC 36951]
MENQQLNNGDDAFIALSYSWAMANGDDSKSRSVVVDGRRLLVTQNLFEAMLQVRQSYGAVRLWVDAICISQEDIEERNEQVSRMSSIYASAAEVIAWLGAEEDLQAFRILDCLGSNSCDLKTSTIHTFKASDGKVIGLCEFRHEKETSRNDLDPDAFPLRSYALELATCVNGVLNRRYFNRRWVVQELFYARHLRFL